MLTGSSFSPRGIPARLPGLGGLPQGKVVLGLLLAKLVLGEAQVAFTFLQSFLEKVHKTDSFFAPNCYFPNSPAKVNFP